MTSFLESLANRLQSQNQRRVVWVIGALLLAIWGFVGAWSYMERRALLQAHAQVLDELNAAVQSQTRSLFRQAESSLMVVNHWMEGHPALDPTQSADFIKLVEDLRRASDGLMDIRLVTHAGELRLVPARGPLSTIRLDDRDYFKAQSNPQTRGFFCRLAGAESLDRALGHSGIGAGAGGGRRHQRRCHQHRV